MDDIIKIVESLEKSGLLIDDATKTVKHEIKKQDSRFLRAMMAPMVASLIAPMASLLAKPAGSSRINTISGEGVMRAGKGQEGGFLPLLALPLMIKVCLEKESQEQEGDLITLIIWIKFFSSTPSFKQYQDY